MENSLEKLIIELKSIEQMGFVESMREYSTGIGYTLESLLEISENRSREPDWGKYEIKTKRKGKNNNSSLFVPEWRYEKFPNWKELVKELGEQYQSKKDPIKKGKALLHAAPYGEPERNGWYIDFNKNNDLFLKQNEDVIATANCESLQRNFSRKLSKVIWILADWEKKDGKEYFHYNEAYLLEDSSFEKFLKLVKKNQILLEMRMYYFTDHPNLRINPNWKPYESHGNAFRCKDGVIFDLYDKKTKILGK